MSSVFDQKIAAVRDNIPRSVLDSPWKRTLLLTVFLIGGIAVFLITLMMGALVGLFKATDNTSRPYALTDKEEGDDPIGRNPGLFTYSKSGYIEPSTLAMWETHKSEGDSDNW